MTQGSRFSLVFNLSTLYFTTVDWSLTMQKKNSGNEMLFLVEQAFVGRDEKRNPLKTPLWEAIQVKCT